MSKGRGTQSVCRWSGAIRTIQTKVLSRGSKAATDAIQRIDKRVPSVSKIDDFAYVKDATVLLAAKDLGVLDKNEKDVLTEALNLRNRSGHPGKYDPGIKKVSAFIEDITVVFK